MEDLGTLNHLSNIINVDVSIRVAHGDLSARMSPSDPVEGRVTLYCDASAGNLGQNTNTSFIYLNKQKMSRLCVKLKLNLCALGYLSVIVEVPQVQVAHSIHTCKQSGVSRGPHDIINVIRVIFKGVQRLIVLRKEVMWKWFSGSFLPNDLYVDACKHLMRRNLNNAVSFPSILSKHIRI